MASSKECLNCILEQLSELKDFRYISMMDGYVLYYKERIFGGIYQKGLMVKITKASMKYMPDSIAEEPYSGAKEMLPVTILEDKEVFTNMVREMYEELPERKIRKKR